MKLQLTPAEAHRLHFVQQKLMKTVSAYQHDRLINAIAEILADVRRRMNNEETDQRRTT